MIEEKDKMLVQWYDTVDKAERPRVYNYIFSLTRDRALSEDLTQEVFETLWKQIEEIREHPNPVGWLIVTAQHKMENESKKAYRQRELTLVEEMLTATEPETESGFLAILDEKLTEDEKKVLTCRIYYQYPFKDIGAFFKCSSAAAQMRYGRAIDRLKKLWEIKK